MHARTGIRILGLAALSLVVIHAAGCGEIELDLSGGTANTHTGTGGSLDQGLGDVPGFSTKPEGGADSFNAGFIGGACHSTADCDYEGAICLGEAEGFPGGMCSLDCAKYCPDLAGATTTFCANAADLGAAASDGLCTVRCDFGQSATGCRPGYQCHALDRHDDPATVVYACVPGEDAPFEPSACHEELLARGIAFSPAVNPMAHPEGHPELLCDVEDPVWVSPLLRGVAYHPSSLADEPAAMFAACPLALALDDAAALMTELGITDTVHYGTYNCRPIAGTSTLSQHAHANAIDYAGFAVAGGAYYTVLDDWEKNQPAPVTTGGQLLANFAVEAHEQLIFHIILTPDYNADHENHFHCDLTPGSNFLK